MMCQKACASLNMSTNTWMSLLSVTRLESLGWVLDSLAELWHICHSVLQLWHKSTTSTSELCPLCSWCLSSQEMAFFGGTQAPSLQNKNSPNYLNRFVQTSGKLQPQINNTGAITQQFKYKIKTTQNPSPTFKLFLCFPPASRSLAPEWMITFKKHPFFGSSSKHFSISNIISSSSS